MKFPRVDEQSVVYVHGKYYAFNGPSASYFNYLAKMAEECENVEEAKSILITTVHMRVRTEPGVKETFQNVPFWDIAHAI